MLVGLIIEEITEEVKNLPSTNQKRSSRDPSVPVVQPKISDDSSRSCGAVNESQKTNTESLFTLKNDPEAIR